MILCEFINNFVAVGRRVSWERAVGILKADIMIMMA